MIRISLAWHKLEHRVHRCGVQRGTFMHQGWNPQWLVSWMISFRISVLKDTCPTIRKDLLEFLIRITGMLMWPGPRHTALSGWLDAWNVGGSLLLSFGAVNPAAYTRESAHNRFFLFLFQSERVIEFCTQSMLFLVPNMTSQPSPAAPG